MGWGKEDKGAKLFSVVPSGKTRGDGHSHIPMEFHLSHLNTRKHFLPVRVGRH